MDVEGAAAFPGLFSCGAGEGIRNGVQFFAVNRFEPAGVGGERVLENQAVKLDGPFGLLVIDE